MSVCITNDVDGYFLWKYAPLWIRCERKFRGEMRGALGFPISILLRKEYEVPELEIGELVYINEMKFNKIKNLDKKQGKQA